ncbi:choline/glycine/proline betaine transport protein/BCCT family betaine/carnitine transporter [Natranaerovirga pectinivora]|uniref:Choline/glycine/proline betaine transport protein/BCCT family betaine/carnitine transporter n=1 Tax=Natranaerovirga pectinivora TaxID=682400 RepID=A0A4R3MST4_9FIRM|nr:BCCT family transporter [Natranaerovirga pectinivora]TCT16094.1 choline/glycine/proline betaine transport protein/BCCT family betaine/carnitine transporter [Natranaerovirga pectinivora]
MDEKQLLEEQRIQAEQEEKLYKRNFTKFGLDMNLNVSLGAGLLILIFSLYALFNLEHANEMFFLVQDTIITNFDWVFILSSNFFIIVCIFLAFSKLGTVRLGGTDSETEFSNFGWYSMLISAGMGIGLMFWSVGEPLYHASQTPPIFASSNATHAAMATTFFHWGLHPWGIYALISLALAFFTYNRKLPLSFRSVFYPLFKDKVFGRLGDVIDTIAVLATLFGLATSLGLGVQQINSGLNFLIGIPFNVTMQVILIVVITFIATLSVVSGIDKGVKFLSETNMKIAGVFMVAVFLLGPTGYILRTFSNSLGLYLNDFVSSSFFISMGDKSWQGGWSVFYLAWWISWSPFVGMFIARISKGRTIREVVLGVLIIPSLLSFIWLSVFGGTAIFVNREMQGGLFSVVENNLPVALFEMLSGLSQIFAADMFVGVIRVVLSIVATVLIITYFITSSDSGSLVVSKITSGGKETSPVRQKVFWACLEGLVAAILLIIGGERALQALQTAVITTGLPFALVLVLMTFSLIKALQVSYTRQKRIKDISKFKRIADHLKVFDKNKAKKNELK